MNPSETSAEFDGRHSGDYLRLARLLERGGGFQLVIATYTSFAYRQQLIERLDGPHVGSAIYEIPPETAPAALIDRLSQLGQDHHPIHLLGLEPWLRLAGPDALAALNYRREHLAEILPTTLVLWVEPTTVATLAAQAPDLWAWRTAVLDFSDLPTAREAIHHEQVFLGNAELAAVEERLADIRAHLAQRRETSAADAELMIEASDLARRVGRLDAALADAETARDAFIRLDHPLGRASAQGRIADILQDRGQLDEALRIRTEEQLPVFERLGDVRSKAVTQGQIADILQDRGQLDEALRIRTEEQLPVFERLGDVRSKAVTQGKIADILQARGQLDEALRIRTEEELPVYERLGDVRSKAVTQGKIADILQDRGQLDEALRIRTEEQLPVFERLGDVRSKAVTQGQIADILQDRGQLDEALRIRTEEQLPVFERLGDVRSKAVTQGQIADILQDRGQLDEALRIRTEEELPVYERLGDVRSKAVTQGQIADILQARGQLDEALRIRTEEELPVYERLGDVREKAVTQGKIADILQARGQLDEALRIRTEEELPVYERLGDVREKAVTQGKIADILQARGQLDEALRIRTEEQLPVFERLGDVREKAVTQGKIADILQARGQLDEALALQQERLPVAEHMGDIVSLAHILWSRARLRLQRGDHGHGGALVDIRDDLSRAYAILLKAGRPDGIGAVGELLAQVMIVAGAADQAIPVLDAVEQAWQTLGNGAGLGRVASLRERIGKPG
ncbi:hypothetical protein EZJ19_13135 [Parasulfuritortus cantonensis]|uniref:Tetratricopeptide repeat protein n=1 Tax=Parasulfuritortus cantonensis TaxID=2528202 RepID=A0A4V2NV65_9PROT|nr:hypothetical protein [Parasulfuritortus cantonensis]TCJ12276.1 hypothetical protein EZJ19_13135 [Parasulfuritortus cantonensis]